MILQRVQRLGIAVLAASTMGYGYTADPLRPLRTAPLIDGKLDDPVWHLAPLVTGFKTFIPDFGREMPESTHAYMAYDSENLYFAFYCFDNDPSTIKTEITSRDNIRPHDFVCINLDSFNDQQSLYAFYVNPLGIQSDSRFAGGNEDFSVDLVWSSAGQITENGYVSEIQIPLKSIRYSTKNPVKMSIFSSAALPGGPNTLHTRNSTLKKDLRS